MTAADALAVMARFGVASADARIEPLAGGITNENWRATSAHSDYVVRRYGRLHVTRAAVAFEHAILEHVGQQLAEVRAPLRALDGTTLVLHDGAFVALFPYIAGTTGARDLASGERAAALLARFHRAAVGMHVAGGLRATRFLGIIPWLREVFTRFAAPTSPIARALPWNALIAALGASALRVVPLARLLPHSIVHGDPNVGNFVSLGGTTRGLIDFDFAHESERIYDVGALIDEFARSHDDAPLEGERVTRLLAAYESEAPLDANERSLLGDAMLRHAATITWYVATRYGQRVPDDVGDALRYARRVQEIADLIGERRLVG